MHLQIKPGLRRVWRAPDAVQIGLDPGRGLVLEGLTAADRDLVERLEDGVDEASLPSGGPGGERTRRLLGLLQAGDVLIRGRAGRGLLARIGPAADRLAPDAAVWGVARAGDGDGWELLADRARREVHVTGAGRLAAELVWTLTAAGVGAVHGPGAASWSFLDGGGHRAPDLVVLVRAAAADSVAAQRLLGADVPHLSVVVREAGVGVGPLVLPGLGPCLRCLDLHRTDRDPAWPRLLAQLPGRPAAADEGETVSSRLGAALAALQVLAHLDRLGATAGSTSAGRAAGTRAAPPLPASAGATLEVDLPDGLVSRRTWTVHPACGRGWAVEAGRPAGGPADARDAPDAPEPPVPASGGGPRPQQGE